MPTIAFDNKNGNWKSTYGFQTTCFSTVEDSFVSARELIPFGFGTRPISYKHTESSVKNQWYDGQQNVSIIGVSFNDNVSFNKIFKTISIEGGKINDSGAAVNTFTANSDHGVNKNSVIGPIKEKGGVYYASVNPTVKNSQSNVEVLGVLEGFDVEGESISIRYNGSDSSSVTKNSKIFFIDLEEDQVLYTSGAPLPSSGSIPVILQTNYDAFTSSIKPSSTVEDFFPNGGLLVEGISVIFLESILTKIQQGQILVGHMTSSLVNGEPPKGQYAEALFSIPATPSFEIYGFNLNYEPTDLDHSK